MRDDLSTALESITKGQSSLNSKPSIFSWSLKPFELTPLRQASLEVLAASPELPTERSTPKIFGGGASDCKRFACQIHV